MLLIDRALETTYITAGIEQNQMSADATSHERLKASDVGVDDFALIATPEVTLLTESHVIDPEFGVSTSETGAISMRSPIRPDEVDDATILLYDTGSSAELLARATIWPFYGIRARAWIAEPDGSSAITIVDGMAALEPVEAGFAEDLVRAWYILTEQPVVTHLLAIPNGASDEDIEHARALLKNAVAAGHANRRDVRKALIADSAVDGDRLVDFFSRVRYELDDLARTAAYSLIARGSGGTRFPLLREIPWRSGEEVTTE